MDYNSIKDKFIDSDFNKDLEIIFKSFNYAYKREDDSLIDFIAMSEIKNLLNKTNQLEVPEGLREYLIKKIAGKFLNFKYSNNQLGEDFDFSESVKSLTEGSFKYDFSSNMSDEQKFLSVLAEYIRGDMEWVHYRKFKW